MKPQRYASPENAFQAIVTQLARDIRHSDLPPSTRIGMVADLDDAVELFREVARVAEMNEDFIVSRPSWLRTITGGLR